MHMRYGALFLSLLLHFVACGTEPPTAQPDTRQDGGSQVFGGGDGQVPKPCVGLECNIHRCGDVRTKLRGKVYDPAGKTPLYNVTVYIPNRTPEPLKAGAQCDACDARVLNPVPVAAITNEKGEFAIDDVPDGKAIPLVLQVGKWRKQLSIDIERCADNVFESPNMMRLPGKSSEGDMPKIALVTGKCDALGCLLPQMGIDASEFTGPGGAGRVHVYRGVEGEDLVSGGAGDAYASLWTRLDVLRQYDVVMLSCECGLFDDIKTADAKANLKAYLDSGGRVFATHWQQAWFRFGDPTFSALANWRTDAPTRNPHAVDTSFPKGKALAAWLQNTGATTTLGEINLTDIHGTVDATNAGTVRWVYGKRTATQDSAKTFSFNTPVGLPPTQQCGRGVISDIHVSETVPNGTGVPPRFPEQCAAVELSPQQKVLEFLLFDLSSCVQDEKLPPMPPR
jgi:hypothetical protein